MAVDLDADDDLCGGRGAGVGSGAGAARGSRILGWKVLWLASWIRIRWSMCIHHVIVGIGDVSFLRVLTWGVGTRLGSVFEGPPWELMVSGAGDMGKLL